MPWHARLSLDYTLEAPRTVARFRHDGPLRVLQSLYPEGHAVCHNVLVHPPGGLVGGDTLDIAVTVGAGAHGLITTPGATRFYRSLGEPALQHTRLTLQPGARAEWLPLEAICYSACLAENRLTADLAPGSELMAWDVTALGLPNAGQPFAQGHFTQHIEMPGLWLERGRIAAQDERLRQSPLGLAGKQCLASLCCMAGSPFDKPRRDMALDVARAVIDTHSLRETAGATCPHGQVIIVRVLSDVVEPAMDLLRQIWAAWRLHLWQLQGTPPRIWAM